MGSQMIYNTRRIHRCNIDSFQSCVFQNYPIRFLICKKKITRTTRVKFFMRMLCWLHQIRTKKNNFLASGWISNKYFTKREVSTPSPLENEISHINPVATCWTIWIGTMECGTASINLNLESFIKAILVLNTHSAGFRLDDEL